MHESALVPRDMALFLFRMLIRIYASNSGRLRHRQFARRGCDGTSDGRIPNSHGGSHKRVAVGAGEKVGDVSRRGASAPSRTAAVNQPRPTAQPLAQAP